jgi:hypothetical protein
MGSNPFSGFNPSNNPYTPLSAGAGTLGFPNPSMQPLGNLGLSDIGYGQNIISTAGPQFDAGAAGTLTPADQALVTEQLQQANLGTETTYGNLGLGGSTMQAQDLGTNQLRSEAEKSLLAKQEETLGLAGLQAGGQFMQAGAQALGGAGSEWGAAVGNLLTGLNQAGTEYQQGYDSLLKAIAGAGNKSAGSGSPLGALSSGISSLLDALFGPGTPAPGTSGGSNQGQDLVNPDTGQVTVPPIPPDPLTSFGDLSFSDTSAGGTGIADLFGSGGLTGTAIGDTLSSALSAGA